MNDQSTDAFAGGFARGFGLVNSAIDARENRQYRKQMMGMQKGLYDVSVRGTTSTAPLKNPEHSCFQLFWDVPER
ncbi:hypothetical protein [Endozoicomonas sp. 8E]|uniref:hypothetical protein n=1 Tax=Endozoicomonas sp. 8E TaxID=3035692 RepID=UPI0029395077|nr:hypothetical protein [Endozoicomonas sp. 8E]WOG27985.1 hypothetical protein P6910_26160 [Endozoicomonas sp. 8E]